MATRTTPILSSKEQARYEFINALTSIRSLAELLVENPGLNAGDHQRFLDGMRTETERLLSLMAVLNLKPDPCGFHGTEESRNNNSSFNG